MEIGVVGLGLIGGSICKAIKKHDENIRIYGYDTDLIATQTAIEQKAIDICVSDFSEFSACQVVFVAAPILYTCDIINRISVATNDACIITDCASVKGYIENNVTAKRYIGGHPMAGVESGGFISSRSYMFENAYYALVGDASCEDYNAVERLVRSFRAIPVNMTAHAHDQAVSKISHLPHMIAYSLVNFSLQNQNSKLLAAGGFKDITRIASSNPELWQSVAKCNTGNIIADIDGFIDTLQGIKTLIVSNEFELLKEQFGMAKIQRDSLAVKNMRGGNLSLKVDITDRVGSIFEVTKILKKYKISLANIAIENSREGQNGILSLVFFDYEAKELAKKVLQNGGMICSE